MATKIGRRAENTYIYGPGPRHSPGQRLGPAPPRGDVHRPRSARAFHACARSARRGRDRLRGRLSARPRVRRRPAVRTQRFSTSLASTSPQVSGVARSRGNRRGTGRRATKAHSTATHRFRGRTHSRACRIGAGPIWWVAHVQGKGGVSAGQRDIGGHGGWLWKCSRQPWDSLTRPGSRCCALNECRPRRRRLPVRLAFPSTCGRAGARDRGEWRPIAQSRPGAIRGRWRVLRWAAEIGLP